MFSCEFCEISRNTFSYRTPPVAASKPRLTEGVSRIPPNFIKKETLAQVFSCEFCENSKSTFSIEHLRTTTSVSCENKLSLKNGWRLRRRVSGNMVNSWQGGEVECDAFIIFSKYIALLSF